jgi:hypothetical protein
VQQYVVGEVIHANVVLQRDLKLRGLGAGCLRLEERRDDTWNNDIH